MPDVVGQLGKRSVVTRVALTDGLPNLHKRLAGERDHLRRSANADQPTRPGNRTKSSISNGSLLRNEVL